MPLWSDGRLAIVDAVGNYDLSRSHFDAQDFMETGTPANKTTSTGWLDRVAKQARNGKCEGGREERGDHGDPHLPRVAEGHAGDAHEGAESSLAPLGRLTAVLLDHVNPF